MNGYEEKKDLLAIDDFYKEIPDIIDWAMKIKNGEGLVEDSCNKCSFRFTSSLSSGCGFDDNY